MLGCRTRRYAWAPDSPSPPHGSTHSQDEHLGKLFLFLCCLFPFLLSNSFYLINPKTLQRYSINIDFFCRKTPMKKRSFAAFSSQGNESFTTPRPRLNKQGFFLSYFSGTACPRSSDPFYSKLPYRMGHYFLDIQQKQQLM